METIKSFKFKLKINRETKDQFQTWSNHLRYLWNASLAHREINWSLGYSTNYYNQAKDLVEAKKEFPFLKEVPAQVLQQKLKDLQLAFDNFFKKRTKYPQPKKRGRCIDSMRFPSPINFNIKRLNKKTGSINLPKIGVVKFIISQKIQGIPRSATVSRDGDNWYISILCKVEHNNPYHKKGIVGIDRGIIKTLSLSNGSTFNFKIDKKLDCKKKKTQRALARKKKFSNNWRKAKAVLQKITRKQRNQRHDWLHKVSTEIIKSHDIVVLEDLKTKNMSKSAKGSINNPGKNVAQKRDLNRSILEQGWYKFQTLLNYKLNWREGQLILIDPSYTSQRCNNCGFISKNNRSRTQFKCIECGHSDNADINAAKNILEAGLASIACGAVA